MSLRTRVVERGSARIGIWVRNGNLVRIEGELRELRVSEWMLPLIDEIHAAARAERLSEVVLDIRSL